LEQLDPLVFRVQLDLLEPQAPIQRYQVQLDLKDLKELPEQEPQEPLVFKVQLA
jgi:hypothetical protein